MKLIIFFIFPILLYSITAAQDYQVDWYVVASGGGHSQSANFGVEGTLGQTVIGRSTSANYLVDAGFWWGTVGPRCEYVTGDANGNGSFNGLDVVYAVSYFKGGPPPPYSCECTPGQTWHVAGDVNASCNFNGLDVSYAVTYLKGGPAPVPCPDCPPRPMLIAPLAPIPVVEPVQTPKPFINGEVERTD